MTDAADRTPDAGAFFVRDRYWHAPALTPALRWEM